MLAIAAIGYSGTDAKFLIEGFRMKTFLKEKQFMRFCFQVDT
jgi:hypothetical protein